MSQGTSIEWTTHTWNPPIWGCSIKSPACEHCYAAKMAHRQVAMGNYPAGITKKGPRGVTWTGQVLTGTAEQVRASAERHLPKRKPGRVFVMSMSDLFHEQVPFAIIDAVFAEMADRRHLTFQVLTKRPEQARRWWTRCCDWFHDRAMGPNIPAPHWFEGWSSTGLLWPSNIWLGCTVEDQRRANERIPHLLELPAPVRFLSCEPLLGPVDLKRVRYQRDGAAAGIDALEGAWSDGKTSSGCPSIGWVIAGGESGTGAHIRPSHPDWFRSLRDQCVEAQVPLLFKQWGAWAPSDATFEQARARDDQFVRLATSGEPCDPLWDFDHRTEPLMQRVGKKAAGRLLDGRTWDQFPDV